MKINLHYLSFHVALAPNRLTKDSIHIIIIEYNASFNFILNLNKKKLLPPHEEAKTIDKYSSLRKDGYQKIK